MFLYEVTHGYLKNDYQFFDTLKTKDRKIRRNCNLLIKLKFRKLEQSSALIYPEKDIVINSRPNADILKKHENRFFSIKLKIFNIWALNFPHVY